MYHLVDIVGSNAGLSCLKAYNTKKQVNNALGIQLPFF